MCEIWKGATLLPRQAAQPEALAGHCGLNFLFVDVEVCVDVLHVVVIFECFHHAEHLLRRCAGELHSILRHPTNFGRRWRDAGGNQSFADFFQWLREA